MHSLTHLLAPVDLDEIPWGALDHVGWLASRCQAIVDIVFVSPSQSECVETQDVFCSRLLTLLAVLTERYALNPSRTSQLARPTTPPIFIGNMQAGDPAQIILRLAARRRHDAIVMGSRGSSPSLGPGSVAGTVLQQAQSPVVIIPNKSQREVVYEASALS